MAMEWLRQIWHWLHQPFLTVAGVDLSVTKIAQALLALVVVWLVTNALSRLALRYFQAREEISDYAAQLLARWVKVIAWVIGIFIVADLIGLSVDFLQHLCRRYRCRHWLWVANGRQQFRLRVIADGGADDAGGRCHQRRRRNGAGAAHRRSRHAFGNASRRHHRHPQHAIHRFSRHQLDGGGQKDAGCILPIVTTAVDNPKRVEDALLQVARQHPQVLADPPPKVWLTKIGDTFAFELLVWTDDPMDGARQLQSDLHYAIHRTLTEQGIALKG
jgi:hypothetical protein